MDGPGSDHRINTECLGNFSIPWPPFPLDFQSPEPLRFLGPISTSHYFHPIPLFPSLLSILSPPCVSLLAASQPFTTSAHFVLPLIIFHRPPAPCAGTRGELGERRPGVGCEGLSWQHLQEREGSKTLPVPSHPLTPPSSPLPHGAAVIPQSQGLGVSGPLANVRLL